MPIIADYYSNIKPVEYISKNTDFTLDKSIVNTQQGLSLLQYNFLLSANDCVIKNYTNNYLTFLYTQANIVDDVKQPTNNSAIAKIGYNNNLLSVTQTLLSAQTSAFFNTLSSNLLQDFVIDFDDQKCKLWVYDKTYKKYMFVDQSKDNNVFFHTLCSTSFDYILDVNNNILNLFTTLTSGSFRWLSCNSGTLSVIVPNTHSLSTINLGLTSSKMDTNYSRNTFVLYSSTNSVDTASLTDIRNNYLFFTPYETWHPTTSSVRGTIDFINLKNYTSKDGFINRIPYFSNKEQRNYNAIITNEYQEKSNEKLELGYNFFTKEYLIKPDKYTKFTLPDTLSPYISININDAGLTESGAYAASSPYFSDRVIKHLDTNFNVNRSNESNGVFLCAWLNENDNRWYDRYYFPQNTSLIQALTSDTSQAISYNTALSAFLNANNIGNVNFYDVQSSLMFEPNSTYYYARVGNKYINKVLDGKQENLVKDGLIVKSIDTGSITDTLQSVFLNGDVYDNVNLGDITTGRFNISFKLTLPDVESAKAYQLIGNNYNIGFGIRKNFYFTPFIILNSGNDVYFYDNNFILIKKNSYSVSSVGNIKEICYVTQTNDIILRTDTGLFKTDIDGQILYKNTNIPVGIKTATIGRHFYGTGNRALFITNDVSPFTIYLSDLQTLTTELFTTTVNSPSSIITINSAISTLPGTKGINIDNKVGASLSGTTVIFTDFETTTSYTGLSTNSLIYDINAHNNNLFVQSKNNIFVFNTKREMLSTISLSTSAVSGLKIEFLTEDYETKLLSFSRNNFGSTIVDKISLTTGEIISSYNIGLSSLTQSGGIFINPTGFYFTENTYKDYNDKFCFTLNLPNTFVVEGSTRIWSTYAHSWSAVSPVSYWAFNYSNISKISDNSIIQVLPLNNLTHHIDMDFNLIDGVISIFIDGVQTAQVDVPSNLLSIYTILKNVVYIGNQNYTNKVITDIVSGQKLLAQNIGISDFRIYNISLSRDFIKYLYLRGLKIDDINIDVSCSSRSSTETIDNIFKYDTPGNLSNDITVYIKGILPDQTSKDKLSKLITDRLASIIPITIDNIEYNFEIQ